MRSPMSTPSGRPCPLGEIFAREPRTASRVPSPVTGVRQPRAMQEQHLYISISDPIDNHHRAMRWFPGEYKTRPLVLYPPPPKLGMQLRFSNPK